MAGARDDTTFANQVAFVLGGRCGQGCRTRSLR
jgi:hypothetical protein